MPRTTFPPTPEASTEIFGKDGDLVIADDAHFSLPPSAIGARDSSTPSSLSDKASDSSYHPNSPVSKHARSIASSRRKSSINGKDDFTLPPPPSRKRKIIQMMQPEQSQVSSTTPSKAEAAAAGAKRKQNSTSSAGRKVARKTAHSLIERRRRSKMNDEFSVLKNMIPACAGQEMHKLAILQASTEYLRYLEQCIKDLKAAASECKTAPSQKNQPYSTDSTSLHETLDQQPQNDLSSNNSDDEEDEDDDNAIDDEMQDSFSSQPPRITPQAPPPSPEHHRTQSYPRPLSSSSHLSYPVSYAGLKNTLSPIAAPPRSPATLWPATPPPSSHFGPLKHHGAAPHAELPLKPEYSALPTPSLASPAHEEEATAALLMLNAVDRRVVLPEPAVAAGVEAGVVPAPSYYGGRRGLSVKDLMSN